VCEMDGWMDVGGCARSPEALWRASGVLQMWSQIRLQVQLGGTQQEGAPTNSSMQLRHER
jgi:hypothetical protein